MKRGEIDGLGRLGGEASLRKNTSTLAHVSREKRTWKKAIAVSQRLTQIRLLLRAWDGLPVSLNWEMARSGKQVSQWALRTFLKTVISGGLWPHPERVSWWMNREVLELHGLHGRRESLKHSLGDGGITCPGLPLLTAPTLLTARQDVCEPGCHSSPPQMLVVWEYSLLSWLGLWITAPTKVTTPTLSQWLPCSLPLVHKCLREGWDRGGEVGREMIWLNILCIEE